MEIKLIKGKSLDELHGLMAIALSLFPYDEMRPLRFFGLRQKPIHQNIAYWRAVAFLNDDVQRSLAFGNDFMVKVLIKGHDKLQILRVKLQLHNIGQVRFLCPPQLQPWSFYQNTLQFLLGKAVCQIFHHCAPSSKFYLM